jgi:hypothetical protein
VIFEAWASRLIVAGVSPTDIEFRGAHASDPAKHGAASSGEGARKSKVGQPSIEQRSPRAGLRVPQEAVKHPVRVLEESSNLPKQVGSCCNGALLSGVVRRPRSVEGGDLAGRILHKAVIHTV